MTSTPDLEALLERADRLCVGGMEFPPSQQEVRDAESLAGSLAAAIRELREEGAGLNESYHDACLKLRDIASERDSLRAELEAAKKERDDARWCLGIAYSNYLDSHPWHDNFTAEVLKALGRDAALAAREGAK